MIARSALRIARLSPAAARRNFNLLSTFFNLLFEKSAAVFAFGLPKPLKHLNLAYGSDSGRPRALSGVPVTEGNNQ
jgi:hypothetical protein